MAAVNSAPSRFLNLPSELRLIIYMELLTTAGAITLYHDETGRQSSLDLCPTILRVSRQIYKESVWLLYERNVFLISLTTPISEDLIRMPAANNPSGPSLDPFGPHQCQWQQRIGLPPIREPDLLRIRDHFTGEEEGLIYPHCFRRFLHIGLVTAGDSIRGLQLDTPFYSETYRLVTDILSCLVADDGFDWTLGGGAALESESIYDTHAVEEEEEEEAEGEREKGKGKGGTAQKAEAKAEEMPLSLVQQKSLDFVLLRHEAITESRYSTSFEEIDILANLLAEVGRKRDLYTQNMIECMQDIEQCRKGR